MFWIFIDQTHGSSTILVKTQFTEKPVYVKVI